MIFWLTFDILAAIAAWNVIKYGTTVKPNTTARIDPN